MIFFAKEKFLQQNIYSEKGIIQVENANAIGFYDNFYSRVVALTNTFQLPFIFQPDSTVSEFVIAEILQDSFRAEQVAPDLFNTSLTISECW